MNKRGRKSAAELSVQPVVTLQPRPAAPAGLSDAEAAVWQGVVETMQGGYWRGADLHTLEHYCRHVATAQSVSEWIARALQDEASGVEDVDRLLRMRERETRAAIAMARTLRLTKQAQISPKTATSKAGSGVPKPWEV